MADDRAVRLKNIRMTIEYEGTRYNGWQRQETTDNTVQGKLEAVLSRMAGETVEIYAAGRTDAGVHARGQVVHFRLATDRLPEEIMNYVNQYLPEDIGVTEAAEASPRFHSRLNAVSKTYIYRIWDSERPNVLDRRYVYPVRGPLDLAAMERAAAFLTGEHDFQAFTSAKKKKKSTVRRVDEIRVERLGGEVRLTFSGSGFLHHMVRIMTGTLLEVGLGKRSPGEMEEILASRSREKAGALVPAKGLLLEKVRYD